MHSFSIDLNESMALNQVAARCQGPHMNRFQRKLLKRSQNIRTSANGQADNTTFAELLARRWRESRPYFTLDGETRERGTCQIPASLRLECLELLP
jgi:hypothetical protein